MGHNTSIPEDSANFHKQQWKIVYQPSENQSQYVKSTQQQSQQAYQQGYRSKIPHGNNRQHMALSFREKYQVGQFLPEFGDYKLIKNTKSGIILQLHNLAFGEEKDYMQYLEKHFWRQRQDIFVKTYFLINQRIKTCCTFNHEFLTQIFVEHMQVRLSDITDIPYPQNLYVLQSCLKGFHKLFQQVGYFKITQDLIGVNRQGKIKVWLNCNLAINTPNFQQAAIFPDQIPQCKMVKQIIDIIERDTDQDTQPNKGFSRYLLDKKKNIHQLTFVQCKNQLEKFAKSLRIKIPTAFNSMLQIINDQIDDSFVPSMKGKNSSFEQFCNNKRPSNVQQINTNKPRKSVKGPANKNSKYFKSINTSSVSSKGILQIGKQPNQLQSIPQINFYRSSQQCSIQSGQGFSSFNPESWQENKKNQIKPYYEHNIQPYTTPQICYQPINANYRVEKSKSSQFISMPSRQSAQPSKNQFNNPPDLQQKFGHFKPIVPYNFLGAQNKNQANFIINGNKISTIIHNNYPSTELVKQQSVPQSSKSLNPTSVKKKKSLISNKELSKKSKKKHLDSSDDESQNEMVNQLNNQTQLKSQKDIHSRSASSLNSGFAQGSNNVINTAHLKKSIETRRAERKFDPKYLSQIQSNQLVNNRKKNGSPHKSVISVSKRSQKGQLDSSIKQSSYDRDQKQRKNIYSSVIAHPELYNRPVNVYINCPPQQQKGGVFKNYYQMQPHELQKMTDSDLHFLNNADEIERKYILQKSGSKDTFDYSGQNYLNVPKKKGPNIGLSEQQKQKYRVFSPSTETNKEESQVQLDPQILKDLAKYGF